MVSLVAYSAVGSPDQKLNLFNRSAHSAGPSVSDLFSGNEVIYSSVTQAMQKPKSYGYLGHQFLHSRHAGRRRWREGREGRTGKKTCVCDLTRRRPEIVKPTKMELQGVQGGVWGANKLQKSRCHGTKIEVWRRLGVSWGGLGAPWRCLGAS